MVIFEVLQRGLRTRMELMLMKLEERKDEGFRRCITLIYDDKNKTLQEEGNSPSQL